MPYFACVLQAHLWICVQVGLARQMGLSSLSIPAEYDVAPSARLWRAYQIDSRVACAPRSR